MQHPSYIYGANKQTRDLSCSIVQASHARVAAVYDRSKHFVDIARSSTTTLQIANVSIFQEIHKRRTYALDTSYFGSLQCARPTSSVLHAG